MPGRESADPPARRDGQVVLVANRFGLGLRLVLRLLGGLGEMVLLGQRMYDNFAEALDDVTVCLMSRADVHTYLLSDPRIAARITEILGHRLADLGQRLSDSVFKSVPSASPPL